MNAEIIETRISKVDVKVTQIDVEESKISVGNAIIIIKAAGMEIELNLLNTLDFLVLTYFKAYIGFERVRDLERKTIRIVTITDRDGCDLPVAIQVASNVCLVRDRNYAGLRPDEEVTSLTKSIFAESLKDVLNYYEEKANDYMPVF